ncbi:hypothetical protein [Cupriavidus pauculus]|uniref:hypothetical protein n=1 Tax=Cupriavidus pauculus TaxID=82633 RepID=UPI001D0C8706|nr:hypothetical protein [Cupriavidus pauculus]
MIHELMPRATVREQGAEAFRKGKEEGDNPHFPQTDAHLEWNAGYKDEKYKPAGLRVAEMHV